MGPVALIYRGDVKLDCKRVTLLQTNSVRLLKPECQEPNANQRDVDLGLTEGRHV